MPDKKMPFCHKCASKITTLTKDNDNSFTLTGCTEESKIKCYDDAKTMCPLLFPEKNKVLICIQGGCAYMNEKPLGIEIEIRDYDIEGHDALEEDERCKKDSEGDWYQMMLWDSKTEVVAESTEVE